MGARSTLAADGADGPVDRVVEHEAVPAPAGIGVCVGVVRVQPPFFGRSDWLSLAVAKFCFVVVGGIVDGFDEAGGHRAHGGHAGHRIPEEDGEEFTGACELVAPFGDALVEIVVLPEVTDEGVQGGGLLALEGDACAHGIGCHQTDQPAGERVFAPGLAGVGEFGV